MTDRVTVGNLYPAAITPIGANRTKSGQADTSPVSNSGKSFREILQEQVRFSHHAEVRLQQKGIQLKPEQMAKLSSAIDKAAAKGAKDSLMLMQDMALIVNVKNRTVVTAMDSTSLKDHVFTQIDSAVIIA